MAAREIIDELLKREWTSPVNFPRQSTAGTLQGGPRSGTPSLSLVDQNKTRRVEVRLGNESADYDFPVVLGTNRNTLA